jgi:N-acetylglucosamine kinase-like BadF-type ATPase
MTHVLGIDAGGTKTVCLLADEQGNMSPRLGPAARTSRPSANSRLKKFFIASWTRRSAVARSFPRRSVSVWPGRPSGRFAIVSAIMRRIGHKAKVVVVNDALVALEAGAPGKPGLS